MRKILVSVVLALVLVTSAAVPALAADYADVTVTATPLYLSITNTNDDTDNLWTINDLGTGTESGVIKTNTTYYSNPVNDADDTTAPNDTSVTDSECYFIVSNAAGASTCDLVVTWGTFSGGGADMTNSDAGTNTGTTYGAWAYYSTMTSYSTNKVLVKASGSATLYTAGLAAEQTLKWGVAILTQQDGWSSASSSTSTLTITAIAD